MTAASLDELLARVLAIDSCAGCGACTLIDAGLTMQQSADGFLRPVRTPGTAAPDGAARAFSRACPGLVVRAQRPATARRHALLGPVVGAWSAFAVDPQFRHRGSSGGVLSALAAFVASEGGRVIGAASDEREVRRTIPVHITSREEALAAAGSRYAPVAVCAAGGLDTADAVVTKPCEATALRALAHDAGAEPPLLLSFFCAGTPSQHATHALLDTLGVTPDDDLADLWYRGRGWPGRFTARLADDREVSASYEESWGRALGPAVQWRCKICPDGVGESADVSAGDFWQADSRGYPVFTEADGVSALIARTVRGRELVERAVAAGVLVVTPVDPDETAAVQPLQTSRRGTLLGRVMGARLARRSVPAMRGFGLWALALARPRDAIRTARGTYRRVRAAGGR